jgi:hypothetical protein
MAKAGAKRARSTLGAIAFAVALLSASDGKAQDCTLRQVADLDLMPLPDGTLLVPVEINGTPRMMVLGVPVAYSAIRRAVADELGMNASIFRGTKSSD